MSAVMEAAAETPECELTGREQLEALMISGKGPGIVGLLDIRLAAVGDGMAAFEATPSLSVYNPIGSVHGGYAATLLDSACGCAVQSKLAWKTGPVRAEGRVVSIGRRAAFAEASLKGLDGTLYASATSTLLVFER
jgi:acyl-coenzyme A thioesterase PaaI-like protein